MIAYVHLCIMCMLYDTHTEVCMLYDTHTEVCMFGTRPQHAYLDEHLHTWKNHQSLSLVLTLQIPDSIPSL